MQVLIRRCQIIQSIFGYSSAFLAAAETLGPLPNEQLNLSTIIIDHLWSKLMSLPFNILAYWP